jgi:hypothetical protein
VEQLARRFESDFIENLLESDALRPQAPVQRTPMHRQDLCDLVARTPAAKKQDAQRTAELSNQCDAHCPSLFFELPEPLGIRFGHRTRKQVSRKERRCLFGIESARRLEKTPVSPDVSRPCPRKEYPLRRPGRTAKLTHNISDHSNHTVVDLVSGLHALLIDRRAQLYHPVLLQHKRCHAAAVEVVVHDEGLQSCP